MRASLRAGKHPGTPPPSTPLFFYPANPTRSSCDTLDKMRARVPDLRSSFSHDEALFKKVYLFTYNFARTPNQKSLPLESATEYWRLLFAKRFKTHMNNWINFLETEYKRSIAKDTWNCMYDFVQLADSDPTLASYDTDGMLFRPFVSFSFSFSFVLGLRMARCLAVNIGRLCRVRAQETGRRCVDGYLVI